MSTQIETAWEIIDRALARHAPVVAATLRGPADEADIDRLARHIGHDLPADLVASLRVHDGQDDPTMLVGFVDYLTLLSASAMIECSDMRVEALGDDVDDVIDWMTPEKVRAIPNCRGWLMFADGQGSGLALDLDPLPAGEVGQVIWLPVDGPTPAPELPSYGAWLTGVSEQLAAGAFTVDELGIRLGD